MSIDRSRFEVYVERHFSVAAFVFFVLLELWMIWSIGEDHKSWVHWGLLVVVLIVYLLFYQLRVRIDEKSIFLSYGIGWVNYEYILSEVQSVILTENPTLKTLLYTPFCYEAVQIITRDSGTFRLPSTNRARLTQTLRARCEHTV